MVSTFPIFNEMIMLTIEMVWSIKSSSAKDVFCWCDFDVTAGDVMFLWQYVTGPTNNFYCPDFAAIDPHNKKKDYISS